MSTLLNDVKYGLRMLRKNAGFTAVAVLTLSLGLTINATVFFFVNDFFLRPLPAREPQQLVVIAQSSPRVAGAGPFSYPDFLDFRRAVEGDGQESSEMARIFSGLVAYQDEAVYLGRFGEAAERVWVHLASDNYFTVLGVQPLLGRLFLPGEGRNPGADPIIVLTHDTWRDRFDADPHLIGQQIRLNSLPFTVVGVTPPGFYGAAWGTALAGFVPASMVGGLYPARQNLLTNRGNTLVFIMGRLRPGASLDQARAAANVVEARLLKDYPADHPAQLMLKATVLRERMSRPTPLVATFMPLIVSALMALALLVLGVAVANVANLLYARAADRERELAVRGALGASRGRLLRQLLAESVLLALGAGMLGTIAALGAGPYLNRLIAPGDMAPPANTGMDWRLFVFTVGASLATGILTGLLPALKATRLDIFPLLKEDARTMAQARHPLRSLLVIGQVAVSCVVLICAGLAVRSLHRLSQVNLGFDPRHILLASFDLGLQRYSNDQARQFRGRLLEKVRELPGVRDAGLADRAPFDMRMGFTSDIRAEGRPVADNAKLQLVACPVVDDAFLRAARIPILEGRDFAARDDASAPRVAIINRVVASNLWPNESPVGKRLRLNGERLEVAGVVGDSRFSAITDEARPLIFLSLAQHDRGNLTLLVRMEGNPVQLTPTVRRIVRELDPELSLDNVRTMEQQISRSPLGLMPVRMGALLAGVQGVIALLLAALGIFGLVSFSVTRRTREIGIRMAMGANTADIIRLVAFQCFRLTVIGLVCGLLLAFALARLRW